MTSTVENKMNNIQVPYMPIESFDPMSVVEKIPKKACKDQREARRIKKMATRQRDNITGDIELILEGMGMKKYLDIFLNQEIPFDTFLNLTDNDLLEIGVVNDQDRGTVLKNLESIRKNKKQLIVSTNPSDDLKIAQNIFNQVHLLQNYCTYIELQMGKNKLTDYKINFSESATTYLKAFTEAALMQSSLMSERLFNENSCDQLIGRIFKASNTELPRHLKEKLRKKKPSKFINKAIATIGLVSLFVVMKNLLQSYIF